MTPRPHRQAGVADGELAYGRAHPHLRIHFEALEDCASLSTSRVEKGEKRGRRMTTRSGASRPELDTGQWKRIRAAVRRRDGNACAVCGSSEKLSVHHVIPARLGGSDEMDNLVTVCVLHHRQADAQLRRREAANLAPALERFEDDPERGIFWGPPGLDGRPTRWSRPWYDWRAEELGQRNC